jgi:sporulation protein YlmC with PRC-barrel domain
MLYSLEDFNGASVIAKDGEMGKVRNVLFDDQSWRIRYLIVDVGSWLSRKEVLISVSAVDQPDWARNTVHVHLTKEQVRHSPDVDSSKPVSRQQEIAMKEYFGWPAYWTATGYAEMAPISIPTGRKFPGQAEDDPHLRSAAAVTGYRVWAEDGEVGRLENFLANTPTWHIGYLEVKAGDWLHSRSVLVPTRWVKSISWADNRISLNHSLKEG